MNTARPIVWRKAAVVAAVAMVVFVGNLRIGVSQAAPLGGSAMVGGPTTAGDSADVRSGNVGSTCLSQHMGVDAHSPAEPTESPDIAHFAPAIFAWDPDVRFVYYRQISKWM